LTVTLLPATGQVHDEAARQNFEFIETFALFSGKTTTTAPAAGGAGALPATPKGYVTVSIGGTNRQVPYY
jgi:hypothetical protein